MKITLLGPSHPYRGGPATFNDRLALQFAAEGQSIDIVTFRLQYPGFLFPGKTQYTTGSAPPGIKIERRLNTINPFNWLITGCRIKKARPDILLIRYWLPFMGPGLGTVARIVKSNRHTRVICIFDNVVPHEKRPGDRILTEYLTGSIDGAIVMSRNVYDDLKTFREDIPVTLSPHPLFDNYGIKMGRAEAAKMLNLSQEYSYLLFFGFIRAYKGVDLLIEAFAEQRLRNRKLRLIIAGEFYEDDTPYRELIKKYHLEDEVILYDRFIKDDEVSQLFSVADLIVLPYRTATQSGVTQVAFHFEIPMLVTDVGGLSEIVTDGKCGYVVKPESGFIADAIADYFENNRKAAYTEGVRLEKEKFSWDKMTAAIIELYNRCLNSATH